MGASLPVASAVGARLARLTVLKRRKFNAPRIASAPGSSSAFSTSVTALTSSRSLESCCASETLSAAFASWRRMTPPQMTCVRNYRRGGTEKPEHYGCYDCRITTPEASEEHG